MAKLTRKRTSKPDKADKRPQKKQKKEKEQITSHTEGSDGSCDVDNWSISSDLSEWTSLSQPEEARETIAALQNILETAEKKDDFWEGFERTVKKEEKRLLGLVADYKKQIEVEDEEFKSQFREFMAVALAPTGIEPSSTDLLSGDASPESHHLHVLSRTLLDRSRDLASEYDKLSQYANNLKLPEDPRPAMEKDYEEARRIICAGRRASEAQIEMSLVFNEKGKKGRRAKSSVRGADQARNKSAEFGKDVHLQAMLKMGREELEKINGGEKAAYGWGKAATRAQKAMKALVKALPKDDAGC